MSGMSVGLFPGLILWVYLTVMAGGSGDFMTIMLGCVKRMIFIRYFRLMTSAFISAAAQQILELVSAVPVHTMGLSTPTTSSLPIWQVATPKVYI